MAIDPEFGAESESRYLAAQAADAKGAVVRGARELAKTLTGAADIRTHARRHPWIAVCSAVAAGFAAGAFLSRPVRENEEAEEGAEEASETRSRPISEGRAKEPSKSFLLSTAGTLFASVLTTLLQRSAAAAFSGGEPPHNGTSHNGSGHHSGPADSARTKRTRAGKPRKRSRV